MIHSQFGERVPNETTDPCDKDSRRHSILPIQKNFAKPSEQPIALDPS